MDDADKIELLRDALIGLLNVSVDQATMWEDCRKAWLKGERAIIATSEGVVNGI